MKRIIKISLLLAFALCSLKSFAEVSLVDSGDEFLPVEEAYKAHLDLQGDTLFIDWDIAPGYFLYGEKFKLEAHTPEVKTTLAPHYEKGKLKFDQYFNKDLEVHYNTTRITVDTAGLGDKFELKLRSQGCADAGLCYAPRTQYFQIDKTSGDISTSKKATVKALDTQTKVTQESTAPAAAAAAATSSDSASKVSGTMNGSKKRSSISV